jgi:REP element-mobilizing transposase RayT
MMPRKPREDAEPGIFHVFARGYGKLPIFRDREDREAYLRLLGETIAAFNWRCLAFCLMGNHVHLVIAVEQANLGAGMQRLHGDYAQKFNLRHGRIGHLFQGRYGAVRIRSDEQLWAVVNYVVNNPVEAGLCRRPEDWPWSSHAAVLDGGAPGWLDVDGLLDWYADGGGDPLARYRGYCGVT